MTGRRAAPPGWLATSDVAGLFDVSASQVAKWARAGLVPHTRTLGGHRRFPEREIRALLRPLEHAGTVTAAGVADPGGHG